jgi:hypothetical protein
MFNDDAVFADLARGVGDSEFTLSMPVPTDPKGAVFVITKRGFPGETPGVLQSETVFEAYRKDDESKRVRYFQCNNGQYSEVDLARLDELDSVSLIDEQRPTATAADALAAAVADDWLLSRTLVDSARSIGDPEIHVKLRWKIERLTRLSNPDVYRSILTQKRARSRVVHTAMNMVHELARAAQHGRLKSSAFATDPTQLESVLLDSRELMSASPEWLAGLFTGMMWMIPEQKATALRATPRPWEGHPDPDSKANDMELKFTQALVQRIDSARVMLPQQRAVFKAAAPKDALDVRGMPWPQPTAKHVESAAAAAAALAAPAAAAAAAVGTEPCQDD